MTERIAAIDVLRGIAVFGIFLINMPLFVAPSDAFFQWRNNLLWTAPADRIVTLILAIFAQGKFYTIFSLLFGLGFGLQLARQADGFRARYTRRLLALLAIGLAHWMLLWWGDILHIYALLGFVLLLLSDTTDEILLSIAAVLTIMPLIAVLVGLSLTNFTDSGAPISGLEFSRRFIQHEIQVYSQAPILEIFEHRLRNNIIRTEFELSWSRELFASFLFGLWAARRRVCELPDEHRPLLRFLACCALPIGFLITAAASILDYNHPGVTISSTHWLLNELREHLGRPTMAYGYAALLLLAKPATWMRPFAAAGRMALTNYLLHSLVFTTVAYSYGLGLYGRIPPTTQLLLCVGFFACQLLLSSWWLRTHTAGPVEWLWRSITNLERPPWKKIPQSTPHPNRNPLSLSNP